MEIKQFTFNPFAENTFILFDETKDCIIIDPGCYEQSEKDELTNFIKSNDLSVDKLVNTHGHIDHVLGNDFIKQTYGVELWMHETELPVYAAVKTYASNYGFPLYQETEVDQFLKEGETVNFGKTELQILFVPGHAPGHVALFHEKQKVCIGGDVLFDGSIGRTDLPGGDFDTLIKSIHEKIFPLGDETVVYCGHGPETTVGKEKATNPFCALV